MKTLATRLWGIFPFRGSFLREKFTFIHYHKVSPEVFRAHIRFLQERYNITHLDMLLDYYEKGTPLPDDCLFITFDDGWKSNYELLPLIEEHNIPITVFLITGLIGAKKSPVPLTLYLTMDSKDINAVDYPTYNERMMLTVDEIREMSRHVNFQSHLVGHHLSTKLSPGQFKSELEESKKTIEDITGQQVYCLAYPYNRVSPREVSFVSSSDYVFARSGARMMNDKKNNRFMLHSIGINGDWSVGELKTALLQSELKTLRDSL